MLGPVARLNFEKFHLRGLAGHTTRGETARDRPGDCGNRESPKTVELSGPREKPKKADIHQKKNGAQPRRQFRSALHVERAAQEAGRQ